MCGISGVIMLNGAPLPIDTSDSLGKMLDAMAYRGPDDKQIEIDRHVALGFRRLSIIGMTNGRQPIQNESGTVSVIANGEIYNYRELKYRLNDHRFTTESDCEAIVHLYEEVGIRLVNQLEGMFALAIWDKSKNKLFLARDPFGIKPLFYTCDSKKFIFASEIKALLQHPDCTREFDWNTALSDPWMYGSISTNLDEPVSYFKNIKQLPAGSWLSIDLGTGRVTNQKYWKLHGYEFSLLKDEREVVMLYRDILKKSVEDCLQSEAGVGLFLSGGIDSASIAAFASKIMPEMQTFSLLSESTYANEDAKFAYQCAESLNLSNHQVIVRNDEAIDIEEWKRLLWICETPFCGPEQIYKYHLHKFAKRHQPDLKVMLSGQGSDEFNGGYSVMFAIENSGWQGFQDSLSTMTIGRLLRNAPQSVNAWAEFMSDLPFTDRYLASISNQPISIDPYMEYVFTKYRDLQMYNCWHEDRTAAANSIENRVPFLNKKLVELCLGLPLEMREQLLWDKTILRKAMENYLPRSIVSRRKVPFFYGSNVRKTYRMMLNLLMKNDYSLIEEAFSCSQTSEILDKDALIRNIDVIYDNPDHPNTEFVLRLANMAMLTQMTVGSASNSISNGEYYEIYGIKLENWENSTDQIRDRLGLNSIAKLGEYIPTISDKFLLLTHPNSNDGRKIYIVVDGAIQYIVSEDDNSAWYRILLSVDGMRDLNSLLREEGIELLDIEKELQEATDYGLINWKAVA